jgi:hypothetical protein
MAKNNPHQVKYVPNPNRPPGTEKLPGTGVPVNPAPPRPKK